MAESARPMPPRTSDRLRNWAISAVGRANRETYENRLVSTAAESVAQVVVKAVEATHPRTRYLLTPAARAMVTARTVGGGRLWDRIVTWQYGI